MTFHNYFVFQLTNVGSCVDHLAKPVSPVTSSDYISACVILVSWARLPPFQNSLDSRWWNIWNIIYTDNGCVSNIIPANIKTDGSYTTSYIQQASPAKGGAPNSMVKVSHGGIVKGSHPILTYIRLRICDSVDICNSDIYITMLVPHFIHILHRRHSHQHIQTNPLALPVPPFLTSSEYRYSKGVELYNCWTVELLE